jgi:protein-S-isoprenylcysteine O-methyltransferase Ste14
MKNRAAAKVLYGFFFAAVLPILLWLWAEKTGPMVPLPPIHFRVSGIVVGGIGLLLMISGMVSLWRLGGGLPMNAFPPPRYVSGGIYCLLFHPIYVGFACLCVGAAIASGSASGLWLVSPTVMLASAALVLGYELPDMQARFGKALPGQRLFTADDESRPTDLQRIRCYLTVLLPWFLLYESIVALNIPADARIAYFPFESRIPILPSTEILYASVYVVVMLVPLAARTRHDLRWFSSRALLSMAIVFPIYLTLPLIAPPRPLIASGLFGELMNLDRLHDTAAAAFPSYHVIWAFLAAGTMGTTRSRKWLGIIWALLVSASCLTTGMHALVDVLGAFAVVWIIVRIDKIWSLLRKFTETIANSWHEWRIGPLRVINHGAYAAGGVFVGVWILDTLLGPHKTLIPVSIFAGGTIGAALWAQWIEGSPALLRPLGFYGGMIGTALGGIVAAHLSDTNIWAVLSALVVAAPFIQGLGRLRCLVQGCCHGHPADEYVGIRFRHPRSRVFKIAALRDVPLHPTQLYSILWNVVIALCVTRLYLLHTTAAMVGGVYLILSGTGRFVEEAYRGEPQTPVLLRMRLYQWIAILTVAIGAFISTISSSRTTSPEPHLSSLAVAVACGLLAWFVTGVDFPDSNRRFARLT